MLLALPIAQSQGLPVQAFAMVVLFYSALWSIKTLQCTHFFHFLFCPPQGVVLCLGSPLPFHLFPFPVMSLRFTLLLVLSVVSKFCYSLLQGPFRAPGPPRSLWMPLALFTSCSAVRFFEHRYHRSSAWVAPVVTMCTAIDSRVRAGLCDCSRLLVQRSPTHGLSVQACASVACLCFCIVCIFSLCLLPFCLCNLPLCCDLN